MYNNNYEEAVKAFMYNEENIHNCSECPENRCMNNGWPCGQQTCWVIAHLNASSKFDEDEDEDIE